MERIVRSISVFFAIILLLSPTFAFSQDFEINNFTLISKERVSRVEYDYTYEADITNSGPDAQNVTATVISNSAYTTVIDDTLSFGDVPAGTTVTSSDTFTIRQDRRYAFSWDNLVWDISYESTPGVELPPDPAYVAPPLDQTVATNMFTATEFLYTGDNPIQTGVDPATIDPVRAAVLRGKVMTRDSNPLSGVTITILNHPEYGQTLSREDGMFDMAVNGGGLLTVRYEKDGYLTAQRKVDVPWQDYAWLPDVALIPLDPEVTVIDFSEPIQVARGSIVTDEDGTRQATLMFQQGTAAEMVMPDGSTQSLSSINVRATEYTVGPNGPNAMPDELPPTSGYTYAVEITADEALAAEATDVRLDRPAYFYLEDFIGFPVGSAVPTGYYDRQQGQWIASENGRVIEVLSITAGLADLDTNGDGAVDDAVTLAALDITEIEQEKIAILYPQTPQQLWRVPIAHFTPWDCNWPYGPPDDWEEPDQPDPEGDDTEDRSCENGGSIIECQNQILGERVPVVGTPFTLNYRSDRVQGRKAAYTLKIPLSGDSVPASLLQIRLEIRVAGREFIETFSPQPNLLYTFIWDRKDAYGRTLQGKHPLSVRIDYKYPAVYYSVESAFVGSFSRARGGSGGGGPGVSITPMRAAQQIKIGRFWVGSIGLWDAHVHGLGGWSLDVHHGYDPIGRNLYLGSGRRRSTGNLTDVIRTVAGNGGRGYDGDGGPAIQAQLNYPRNTAISADNSIYIVDAGNFRIRRVSPDGIITTVAGTGTSGHSGDGGLAINAQLLGPKDIALGPNGSIYITSFSYAEGGYVRRVTPDGRITTVAGGGNLPPGEIGDGLPATEAVLHEPYGIAVAQDGSLYVTDFIKHRVRRIGGDGIITTVAGGGTGGDGGLATEAAVSSPSDVAVAPDGSLYITTGELKVRRIGPDGIITTVAGGGTGGDGGPATEARLYWPTGVVVASNGRFYIADIFGHRIRRVGPEGIITTVAGTGNSGYNGESNSATGAQLNRPIGVSIAPDGRLYIADNWNNRIREVSPILPKFSDTDMFSPSEDGSELYHFDLNGRHLRTLHTLTGAVLYKFNYDDDGLPVSVEDGDGNTTTIERDGDGNPLVIVGPYGQRTPLTQDVNGYLETITNPAGESLQFTYTDDGLMLSKTDPRGYSYNYYYDEDGRLIKAADPAGGFKELSRLELERTETIKRGYEVSVTTAMGRTDTYVVEHLSTGEKRLLNTFGCCGQTEVLIDTDGGRTISYADGTIVTEVYGPDPRWGMLAPVIQNQTITTPGGLQFVTERDRTVTLAIPDDPLSLDTSTETLTINGLTYTITFNADQNQVSTTSPEGRQGYIEIDYLGRVVKEQVSGILYPVHYKYDSQGRLDKVTQGPGDNPAVDRVYDIDYNIKGYVDRITGPLSRSVSFLYDNAARVREQILSDGRQITFITDSNGNIKSIKPPGRPSHFFSYSSVNLLESYTPPVLPDVQNSATIYDNNLDRDLEQLTRPDGLILDPVYDFTKDRLEGIILSDGREIEVTYYDGDPLGEPDTSQVKEIRVLPENVSVFYIYDGFLITKKNWEGVFQGAVGYVYDNDFRIQSLNINSADFFQADFEYDDDGLMSRVGASISAVPLAVDFSIDRDPENDLVTGTNLDKIKTTHTYNNFGELSIYQALVDNTVIFETIYDMVGKTRDSLGRITDLTETVAGVTTNYRYEYDEAGRLADVWKNGEYVSQYSYDENGNRTMHTNPSNGTGIIPTDVEHDEQDRLLRYGAKTFTYTSNGELLTKTENGKITRYYYDVLGNLRAVTLSDTTEIEYIIDGQNRRIGKKVNGVMLQGFLYKDRLNPVAELDGKNDIVSVFVYATRPNIPDYMISRKEDGTTWVVYQIISDHQGSPRLVVSSTTGQVAQRLDYDEFGNVIDNNNTGFQPFGFAGGIYDAETGLVLFGARDYDPETGRWIAKDPILFSGGANLYEYVMGDPINFFDPYGFATWKKCPFTSKWCKSAYKAKLRSKPEEKFELEGVRDWCLKLEKEWDYYKDQEKVCADAKDPLDCIISDRLQTAYMDYNFNYKSWKDAGLTEDQKKREAGKFIWDMIKSIRGFAIEYWFHPQSHGQKEHR
jgi:RHS repeat-associated protein